MTTQTLASTDIDTGVVGGLSANWASTFITGLRRSATGFIGFVVFAIICVGSIVVPIVIHPDLTQHPNIAFHAPSAAHWLGTDDQGRDTFTLLITGGGGVVIVGLVSALLATAIAITFGALAAYKAGAVDSITVQVADFFLTIPQFPLLIVLSAYLRLNNVVYLALLLGLLGWPGLLRAVRAQVLSLKEREYVEAAKLANLGTARVVFRDILPNMASYIMINFILAVTSAVYALAGLYLLGLAPMSGSNWGIMIHEAWIKGAVFYPPAMWFILSPLLAIAILQLSAIWFVRSLEEMLNPKLRAQG